MSLSLDVQDFIRKSYETAPKPLYIAALGSLLKKEGHEVKHLLSEIEKMDGFLVLRGREKERTLITTIEDKDEAEKLLQSYKKNQIDKNDIKYLLSIHRNILNAFCSKQKTTGSLFIDSTVPFHFYIEKEKDDLIEIPPDMLFDIDVVHNLKTTDDAILKKLADDIRTWAKDNGIDVLFPTKIIKTDISLLGKMLSVIPQKNWNQISLPLDVIDILLKSK